jgi:tRNA threonylcarbamoyladenosine biosynthesis protein TsaB
MRVLALDTTTRGGSAAVVEDAHVIAEHAGDPTRSHAERLPGDLVNLLRSVNVPMSAIDAFAVAVGPGSFTGLRIGIATMQGLAFVHRRRLVPVSALDALAYAASVDLVPGTVVGAWMDAHRRDVFSALYRVCEAPLYSRARLEELDPPSVDDPAATLLRWRVLASPELFVGDGAGAYAQLIGSTPIVSTSCLAGVIGRVASALYTAGGTGVDPAAVQPLYVRRPDAELAREKGQPAES